MSRTLIDGGISLAVTTIAVDRSHRVLLDAVSLATTTLTVDRSAKVLLEGASLAVGGWPIAGTATESAQRLPRAKVIHDDN
jgi:hypothetical protein